MESILNEAVFRVLRRFWEDNPPKSTTPLPPQRGRYSGARDLSALWAAYYSTINPPPTHPYESVLRSMSMEMERFSKQQARAHPAFHFADEEIQRGITELQNTHTLINSLILASSPLYTMIREQIARYAYTVGSYYSNTNWVNFNNQYNTDVATYNHAMVTVIRRSLRISLCRNCPPNLGPNDYRCQNTLNPVYSSIATSGYQTKFSGGKINAAVGRCGHGGRSDPDRVKNVTGGINKQSTDPSYSPHWFLHKKAAEQAIEHLEYFLDGGNGAGGLRQSLGASKFRELFKVTYDFGVQPQAVITLTPYSIAFVIDNTGSMHDDINAVKAGVSVIANNLRNRIVSDQPANVVMIAFNDPSTEVERTFTTVQQYQSFMTTFTYNKGSGGDCPEMTFTGINAALDYMHSTAGSTDRQSMIMVFTDAGAKDFCLLNSVTSRARSMGVIVESFAKVPMNCGDALSCVHGLRGRREALNNVTSAQRVERVERQAGTALGSITQATGGGQHSLGSGLSQSVASVLTKVLQAGLPSRVVASNVRVMTAELAIGSQTLMVPVDFSMSDVALEVFTNDPINTQVTVYRPDGTLEKEDVNRLIVYRNTTMYIWIRPQAIIGGQWRVILQLPSSARVVIETDSLIYFSLDLFDANLTSISGYPIQGTTYIAEVSISGRSLLSNVQSIQLHRPDTLLTTSGQLTAVNSWTPNVYRTNITLLYEAELVPRLIATDTLGNSVVREYPTPFRLSLVSLRRIFSPYSAIYPLPGQVFTITVELNNTGASATFTLQATSTVFSVSPAVSSVALNSGGSTQLSINVNVPRTATAGTVDTISISVLDSSSKQLNAIQESVVVGITAVPVIPSDATPPTCRTLTIRDTCTRNLAPNCTLETWQMTYGAVDSGTGINRLVTGENYTTTGFNAVNGTASVNITLTVSCCDVTPQVVIFDVAGNVGLCTHTRVPATTSTTVSISTVKAATLPPTTKAVEDEPLDNTVQLAATIGGSLAAVGLLAAGTVVAAKLLKKCRLQDKIGTKSEKGQAPPISTQLPANIGRR